MPLITFWRSSKDAVLEMSVDRLVSIAGDGTLKDGSETSFEFREFLAEVDAESLASYAVHCLENPFSDSGRVLQDVINEVGRRLGFVVENGRYQGVRNDIGFDGIWASEHVSLIVEVKTTTAYAMDLDVIAKYRDRLAEAHRIPEDTPALIVIGRNDTESLEAQVRGSRHAWSMRIIGVDALVKLMRVNLSTFSQEVTEKIHTILQPFEYTRVDKIVDVVFTTAEDKTHESDSFDEVQESGTTKTQRQIDKTPRSILDAKKAAAVERLSARLGRPLVRKRYSLYSDSTDQLHAVIAVSKRYTRSGSEFYWYAYHNEPQRTFLGAADKGYMVFAMADSEESFAVPYEVLEKYWDDFYETVEENGSLYKHIYIYRSLERICLRVNKIGGTEIDLSPFVA